MLFNFNRLIDLNISIAIWLLLDFDGAANHSSFPLKYSLSIGISLSHTRTHTYSHLGKHTDISIDSFMSFSLQFQFVVLMINSAIWSNWILFAWAVSIVVFFVNDIRISFVGACSAHHFAYFRLANSDYFAVYSVFRPLCPMMLVSYGNFLVSIGLLHDDSCSLFIWSVVVGVLLLSTAHTRFMSCLSSNSISHSHLTLNSNPFLIRMNMLEFPYVPSSKIVKIDVLLFGTCQSCVYFFHSSSIIFPMLAFPLAHFLCWSICDFPLLSITWALP